MARCWAEWGRSSPNRNRNQVESDEKVYSAADAGKRNPRIQADPGVWRAWFSCGFSFGSGSGRGLGPGRGACPLVLGKNELADADGDRGDLDALVLAAELQRLLQAQLA
jgi:hypothetical protein